MSDALDLKHFYRDEDGFFYCGNCGVDRLSVRRSGHTTGCPHAASDAFARVGMCAGCGRDGGHEEWCETRSNA